MIGKSLNERGRQPGPTNQVVMELALVLLSNGVRLTQRLPAETGPIMCNVPDMPEPAPLDAVLLSVLGQGVAAGMQEIAKRQASRIVVPGQ